MLATDVLLHLILEACGAVALRCALGLCNHVEHRRRRAAIRAALWVMIAVPMSYLTVQLVG